MRGQQFHGHQFGRQYSGRMVLRAQADACPGVFAPHDAADGAVARVRLPGGRITAAALRVVAGCADDLGDGSVHLTSRGNVQLRGLDRGDDAVVDALVRRLSAVGLLPAPEHERVRNFLASPLSGLAGGLVDVGPLAGELDVAVCARPETARLPGRFLFALDDGRGDVSDEGPDLCWRAVSSGTGALLLAGQDTGLRIPVSEAVSALVAVALRFLEVRGAAWRVHELRDPAMVLDCLTGARGTCPAGARGTAARLAQAGSLAPCPLGEFARDDGGTGMVVAPVLGECTSGQLRAIADLLTDVTAPTAPARTAERAAPAQGATARAATAQEATARAAPAQETTARAATAQEAMARAAPARTAAARTAPAQEAMARTAPAQAATARAVAVITPWRSIVLPGTGDLAGTGLLAGPGERAAGVSACIGRPGCAKSRADVRANARSLLEVLPAGVRVHFSGCERRCGRPHGPHLDVVARKEEL